MSKKQLSAIRAKAGRKGGLATAKKHGTEFIQERGRKGGKIGGLRTLIRFGSEYYSHIRLLRVQNA